MVLRQRTPGIQQEVIAKSHMFTSRNYTPFVNANVKDPTDDFNESINNNLQASDTKFKFGYASFVRSTGSVVSQDGDMK